MNSGNQNVIVLRYFFVFKQDSYPHFHDLTNRLTKFEFDTLVCKLAFTATCIITKLYSLIFFLQSALAAALINVQIPVFLGDMVQVVAEAAAKQYGNYMSEIRGPALKLIVAYCLQVE